MFGTFVESEEEREFIEFLVKEKVYAHYMRNLATTTMHSDKDGNRFENCWNVFKKLNYVDSWIDGSFNWEEADFPYKTKVLHPEDWEAKYRDERNWEFWVELHNKWCDTIGSSNNFIIIEDW